MRKDQDEQAGQAKTKYKEARNWKNEEHKWERNKQNRKQPDGGPEGSNMKENMERRAPRRKLDVQHTREAKETTQTPEMDSKETGSTKGGDQ